MISSKYDARFYQTAQALFFAIKDTPQSLTNSEALADVQDKIDQDAAAAIDNESGGGEPIAFSKTLNELGNIIHREFLVGMSSTCEHSCYP